MQVAAVAAPLTALVGLLSAYVITRHRFVGRRAFEFLTLVSFAIPGTVIGVSYIVAFNVAPLELTGGMAILVLCFVFRNMPVGVRAGVAALAQIDKTLDEASSTLRASTLRTLTQVVLPLLRPAILATLVFSFTHAMTAVSAVIFLATAKYNLATVYIINRVEAGEYPLAIAYSSVLIVFMLLVLLGMQQDHRRSAARPPHDGRAWPRDTEHHGQGRGRRRLRARVEALRRRHRRRRCLVPRASPASSARCSARRAAARRRRCAWWPGSSPCRAAAS